MSFPLTSEEKAVIETGHVTFRIKVLTMSLEMLEIFISILDKQLSSIHY
jgi:hypothetical protein